ncbi:MAG TPA: class II fructose-bisphosphate aldolase [Micromonosporaceae bacterium]|nr:class II fructose-bisphosphate aldolase [Micromonosporaceae bacterium]
MPLTPTADIVARAHGLGQGVAAFNVIQLEHAEAFVEAAQLAGTPVVLQISQNTVRYHGVLRPLALATLAVAEAAAVPVAVHLDHAESTELVEQAVGLGLQSVMFDASMLSYASNVAATGRVVRHCHERGVWVEAELGEIGGKDGVHAPGVRTDPGEARAFVQATGVDALAVAVGTSHAMLTQDAAPDFGLIARLRAAVPVPLVLHGSSGVTDADLARAVRAGMTKINVATRLNKAFTQAVRVALADGEVVDPRRYTGPARGAMAAEARRLCDVLRLAS